MPEEVRSETEEELRCLFCDCLRALARSRAGRHLLNARKEFLLAVRSAVDARIRRIEAATEEARRIEVE